MPSTPVQLYRYDISGGMAAQMSQAFLGRHLEAVWHTAIVAFGSEFYFDGGVGVERATPGETRFGRPLRIDQLGNTSKTESQFELWCQQMHATKYGPACYNLLQRNCNHFTEDAALFLLGRSIPDDVTGMIPMMLSSPLGAMIRPILETITTAPPRAASGARTSFASPTLTASSPAPAGGVGGGGLFNPAAELHAEAAEEFALAIAMLESSATDDCPKALACAETLHRIVSNVSGAPDNTKFRRVSKKTTAYASKLQPFELVPMVLTCCGFKDMGDEWVLSDADGSLAILALIQSRLADAIVHIETERAIAQSLKQASSNSRDQGALPEAACGSQIPSVTDAAKKNKSRRCMPLFSIDELLNFVPRAPMRIPKRYAPRDGRSSAVDEGPRLLICHDFKGGYQPGDDVYFADPTHEAASHVIKNAYFAQYLDIVDVFVYFSHSFVTIPPLEWVRCCHRHGVPIYGTLVIEHDAGEEFARKILGSDALMRAAVRKLVAVCVDRQFNGYLLNVESAIPQSLVGVLLEFVGLLHSSVQQATSGTGGVLWYDAVATSGRIEYQNALTEKNKPFFMKCGGIFTNYWWNPLSLQLSAFVADGAQRSRRNIYAGIDVFGRRTFGGGGMTCNAALTEIIGAQQSAALFAPGWTLESCSDSVEFLARDGAFWKLIEGFFTGGGRSTAVRELPFSSSFRSPVAYCRQYFIKGKVAAYSSWCQLSCQDPLLPGIDLNTSAWSGTASDVNCMLLSKNTLTKVVDSADRNWRTAAAKLRYVIGDAWVGDRHAEIVVSEVIAPGFVAAIPIAGFRPTNSYATLAVTMVVRHAADLVLIGMLKVSSRAAELLLVEVTSCGEGWHKVKSEAGTIEAGEPFTLYAVCEPADSKVSPTAVDLGCVSFRTVDSVAGTTIVARTENNTVFRAAVVADGENQFFLRLTATPPLPPGLTISLVGCCSTRREIFLGMWLSDDEDVMHDEAGCCSALDVAYSGSEAITAVKVALCSEMNEDETVVDVAVQVA
jgi:hypothetical protein